MQVTDQVPANFRRADSVNKAYEIASADRSFLPCLSGS